MNVSTNCDWGSNWLYIRFFQQNITDYIAKFLKSLNIDEIQKENTGNNTLEAYFTVINMELLSIF